SQWPDTSWKKIFTSYLMETNRYFVFPRRSFTTNFGDEGTHTDRRGLFQVPLAGKMLDEPFAPFSKEAAFYDTWFELEPDCLKNILPDISHKDFTLDLYGTKHPESINSEFVFTTRKSSDIEKSYGLEMIPAVMNIIHNIPGDMICFSKKEFVSDESPEKHLLHYNTAAIHKDIYHNIIEKSATEIATVIFKEMKNDLEFQQKYPRFLIISLIRDFASRDQIISVSRHIEYPNFKHTVINFFDHSMCIDAKSKLDFEKANINNPVMVINEIIKNASPELILIVPGIIQIDANTLSVAQEIFNKYPEIQWVNGFNPDVTNESSARWNRDWIRSLSGECANSSLSFQNVIFNRQLWDQLNLKMIQNSSLNEYSIWKQFAHHTDMYTIDKSFVKQDVPSGLKQNYNQSFSRYSATKHSQPISHRFLSGLLYPSYRHNIPFLKTWYSQLNHIPPLLHWDEKLNTCYFLW
ncbi:MAG: hypothetical protein ACE5D7_09985, partial [Fidelibacterota bacterium]